MKIEIIFLHKSFQNNDKNLNCETSGGEWLVSFLVAQARVWLITPRGKQSSYETTIAWEPIANIKLIQYRGTSSITSDANRS